MNIHSVNSRPSCMAPNWMKAGILDILHCLSSDTPVCEPAAVYLYFRLLQTFTADKCCLWPRVAWHFLGGELLEEDISHSSTDHYKIFCVPVRGAFFFSFLQWALEYTLKHAATYFGWRKAVRHLLRSPTMLHPKAYPSLLPETRCHWSKDKHLTGPRCPSSTWE